MTLQDKINKADMARLTKILGDEVKARPKNPIGANTQYIAALKYAFTTLEKEIRLMNPGKTGHYRDYIIANLTAQGKFFNSGPNYPVQLTLDFKNNGGEAITLEINYDNPAHNIEDPKSWRSNGMAAVCLYRAVEKGERSSPRGEEQRVWNLYPHFGYELTSGTTLLLRGHSYITFTSMIMGRPSRPADAKNNDALDRPKNQLTVKAPMTGDVEILKFKDLKKNQRDISKAEKVADEMVKEAKA